MTTEEFIRRAREVHGNKYDYSKTKYVNARTKVIIICPEHGEFLQQHNSHLGRQGCAKCGNLRRGLSKKKTCEDFIRKAREIHGDKYDYSKVEYIKAIEKVIIICPKHGEFLQKPNDHLSGRGCNKCAILYRSALKTKTSEDFIERARKVHGDKYDYSKVNYNASLKNVIIICSIHGEFLQKPKVHLNGKGCQKCGGGKKSTTEEFIQKAKEIHGDKYDYSKIKYINSKINVIIICPKHGEFSQKPYGHLSGQGCAKCRGQGLNYLPIKEVKKIIQPLKIKTGQEYFEWWDNNKEYCQENGIPKQPNSFYKRNK